MRIHFAEGSVLGVIAGDVVGSVFERASVKHTDFPLFSPRSRFTDDTVLTVATASAILGDGDYPRAYLAFGRRYPDAGYGGAFYEWLHNPRPAPYGSWGNGSAMRVAPVGLAFDTLERVLQEAKRSAEVTHDHPEGIKGAQAVALAVFRARQGATKEEIRTDVADRFGYALDRRIEDVRPTYRWDVSCQGSVPEAILAFLDATDVESAIRLAVSLGGDRDTQAAIAGGVAQAFYRDIPAGIVDEVMRRLPQEFVDVMGEFDGVYGGR